MLLELSIKTKKQPIHKPFKSSSPKYFLRSDKFGLAKAHHKYFIIEMLLNSCNIQNIWDFLIFTNSIYIDLEAEKDQQGHKLLKQALSWWF